MAWQKKARNLCAQEPGREIRYAEAADNLNIVTAAGQSQSQETADGYAIVITILDDRHRIITCKDGFRWILQRHKSGGAQRPWRSLGYFRTKTALIRVYARLNAQTDSNLMAVLIALPDVIGGAS